MEQTNVLPHALSLADPTRLSGIDLHAIGPQPRGIHQCLPNGLAETAGLDADFNDHDGGLGAGDW